MKHLKLAMCAAGLALVTLQASAQVTANASAAGILNLQESIVDNGDGTWTYNYNMTNLTEVNNVWWVVLYTNLTPTSATPFGDGTHTGWQFLYGPPDPAITAPSGQSNVVYSWSAGDSWPSSAPNGIALGQTVGGFSFTAAAYDASVKEFYADVVPDWGGGNLGLNANGSQIFSYSGTTGMMAPVPEPETYAMFGLGLATLALLRRRSIKTGQA